LIPWRRKRWEKPYTDFKISGHVCQNNNYEDRHAVVEIVLEAHTSASLTLRATSTVNSDATDESFAIDDVRILPLDA
jgi:hypothetical protein